MTLLKKLLQGWAKFFTKKKDKEEDSEDETVGHLSFFIAKDGTILVDCSYKEEPLYQDMFIEMFHSVNNGHLTTDTLHIIYEECLRTDRLPVYLNIVQKLSTMQLEQYQEFAEMNNLECDDTDDSPVVRPTEVINPDAQNVGE